MSETPEITRAYRSTTSVEMDRTAHQKLKELQAKTKLPMYRLSSLVVEHGVKPFEEAYGKFMKQKEGDTPQVDQ